MKLYSGDPRSLQGYPGLRCPVAGGLMPALWSASPCKLWCLGSSSQAASSNSYCGLQPHLLCRPHCHHCRAEDAAMGASGSPPESHHHQQAGLDQALDRQAHLQVETEHLGAPWVGGRWGRRWGSWWPAAGVEVMGEKKLGTGSHEQQPPIDSLLLWSHPSPLSQPNEHNCSLGEWLVKDTREKDPSLEMGCGWKLQKRVQKSQVFFESVAIQVIWCESSKVLTPPASSAVTASSPRSKSMLCICVFVFVFQVYLYLCLRWQGFLITHFVNVTVKSIFKRKERFFVKTWFSNNHKQRPSSSWSKSSNITLCIFQNYMRQTEGYYATIVHKLRERYQCPYYMWRCVLYNIIFLPYNIGVKISSE